MSSTAPFRSALLAATLLVPFAVVAPARAQAPAAPPAASPTMQSQAPAPDVTAADAAKLATQLRSWLVGVLGPNITVPDAPFKVAAEGDHYLLSVPIAGQVAGSGGITIAAEPLTVSLRPLDATRWSILGMQIPSPLRIDNPNAKPTQLKSYAVKIADQTTTGIFDPSFATASSYDTQLRDYTAVTDGPNGMQTSHLDSLTAKTVWAPSGGGRVNMQTATSADKMTSAAAMPDGTPFSVSVAQIAGHGHIDGLLVSEIGPIIRAAAEMVPVLQAAAAAPKPADGKPHAPIPPAARPAARALLASLRTLLGGYEQEFSLKQISFSSGGNAGTLADATLGLGGGAPNGRLDLHMTVAMDGLASPEIPPGIFTDYLPRHIAFKPRISGVPSQDLANLISHAIDSDGTNDDELAQEATALLGKGPLSIGVDDLALAMGPATLTGSGAVQVSSPADYVAQASLRLIGFEALMADANNRPELAQAAPVMIFLKGIGKQEGDAVVWNISYQDNKLLVNGTDLSAMVPKK